MCQNPKIIGLQVSNGREPALTWPAVCRARGSRALVIHLFLPAVLGGWYYYPQFLNEETETHGGWVNYRSHVVNEG